LASVISGNSASVGGGLLIGPGATVLMDSSTIQTNDGTYGGGIYNWDRLEIKNSAIISNTALKGGGLYTADSTATLTNTTISGNSATEDGAGI